MVEPVHPVGDRERILDQTRQAYRGYSESGHDQRWAQSGPGWRRAIDERDRWLAEAVRPAGACTLVDCGCGDGAVGDALGSAGLAPTAYLGFDLLEERVLRARQCVPWGSFEVASADRLPIADGSAHVVTALTLFSSLRDDWLRQAVATEMQRVLAPEGRIVIYDMRYPSPSNHNVRPISVKEFRRLFPGWYISARTLTVLPPLVRSVVGNGRRRYAILGSVPILRSHLGLIITRSAAQNASSRPAG